MLWASNVIRPNLCQSIVMCSMSSVSNGSTINNISSVSVRGVKVIQKETIAVNIGVNSPSPTPGNKRTRRGERRTTANSCEIF